MTMLQLLLSFYILAAMTFAAYNDDRFQDSNVVSLGTIENVQLREIDGEHSQKMTTIELSGDEVGKRDRAVSSLADKLLRAVQVICLETHMVVTVAKANVLEFGVKKADQIAFLNNNEELCTQAEEYSNETHYIYGTYYSKCDTEVIQLTDRKEYVSKVFIRNHVSVNSMSYDTMQVAKKLNLLVLEASVLQVRCVRLNEKEENVPQPVSPGTDAFPRSVLEQLQMNEQNHTFVLQMYDNQWFSNPWLKFPHVLRIGQRVFVDVFLQPYPTNAEDGFRPLLKECFFTRNSSPRSQPKHVLISTGCPMDTSAMVHYSKLRSAMHSSRFSFEPRQFYFPGSFMFLHCHVSVCAWKDPTGAKTPSLPAGIVQCPDGLHCNEMNFMASPEHDGQPDPRSASPAAEPQEERGYYVSSGPLHPVMMEANREEPEDDHRKRFNIANMSASQSRCRPCESADAQLHEVTGSLHNDRITVVRGLGTGSVVAISSAAFVVGMLLVGGMWYIYEVTRAERVVRKNRRCTDDCMSSSESSTQPTACLTATDTL